MTERVQTPNILEFPKFGQGPCLGRLAELLNKLGIDRSALSKRSVVVCGSNGKGSTAAFCEAIGRAWGLRVGLFTSPHLYDVRERWQINRELIENTKLQELSRQIMSAARAMPQAAEFCNFELQFALACLWFQEQSCDLMILEAGIGGRLDPVRLAHAKTTAVVSLDLEHTAILGTSLELIALDKSEACAAGGTVVYGPSCRPFQSLLVESNASRKVQSVFLPLGQSADFSRASLPQFQRENAAVANSLMLHWAQNFGFSAPPINDEWLQLRWPGRLEELSVQPLTVIDVGHTPEGVRAAIAALREKYPGRHWTFVVGASADKDISGILRQVATVTDRFIATRAHHKGAPADEIAKQIRQLKPKAQISTIADISEVVSQIRETGHNGEAFGVFGGLFLAAEFAFAWRGNDPRSLQFA